MVNLEWYRTFKSIYQNGNLTRAAEELLISQPNVSIQLAALESYIGQKLFERLPRKLVPTEYGKLLYTQVVESIQNLERVEVEFRKAALLRLKNLRIGTPIEYANDILLEKFSNCDLDVHFRFGMPDELLKGLKDRELDFSIVTKRIENEKLTFEPLVTEQFMIVAHAGYDSRELESYIKIADMDAVEKWLLKQNWIAYDNKLSIIRRFWLDNFKKRPLIKPHYVIPNIDMILKAVGLNYGITVASDMFVDEILMHQQLKVLWKGEKKSVNQLWLAYDPLAVSEGQILEMRNILGI